MLEIIDLSQELFEGMPVYKNHPAVRISVEKTHEEWDGISNPDTSTPSLLKLEMGEHTGTHVDAISHMAKEHHRHSIDTMPLKMFFSEGICLDFRHKDLEELITAEEIEGVLNASGMRINKGDAVLFCTGHYQKHYGTDKWPKGPGLSIDAAEWLGHQGIASFGVETMSPGIPKVSNVEVHRICGRMHFTHYENLVNLDLLLGRGRFRFVGLPLKIRGGTGSPVRAVAVFEESV